MEILAESRDKYLQVEGRPEKSIARHRLILNAIKARDRERAERLMRDHLMDIENSLFAAKRKRTGVSGSRKERREKAQTSS